MHPQADSRLAGCTDRGRTGAQGLRCQCEWWLPRAHRYPQANHCETQCGDQRRAEGARCEDQTGDRRHRSSRGYGAVICGTDQGRPCQMEQGHQGSRYPGGMRQAIAVGRSIEVGGRPFCDDPAAPHIGQMPGAWTRSGPVRLHVAIDSYRPTMAAIRAGYRSP